MRYETDYSSENIPHWVATAQTIFEHSLYIFFRGSLQISLLILSELISSFMTEAVII